MVGRYHNQVLSPSLVLNLIKRSCEVNITESLSLIESVGGTIPRVMSLIQQKSHDSRLCVQIALFSTTPLWRIIDENTHLIITIDLDAFH